MLGKAICALLLRTMLTQTQQRFAIEQPLLS